MRQWLPIVGVVLVDAVVVGEDRARADVGALADRGVAARRSGAAPWRPSPIVGVLGLDEVPILPLRAELGAGPQVGERPDRGAGADHGERRRGCARRSAPSPTSTSVSVVSGPMTASLADGRRAVQLGAGQDRRRRGRGSTSASIQVVAGSTTVTPSRIQPLDDPAVQLRAEPGQLHPVVDALGLPRGRRSGGRRRRRPSAAGDRRRTSVRYFSPWALSVPTWASASRSTVARRRRRCPELISVIARCSSVASFCSTIAATSPLGVAQDPAVAGRVGAASAVSTVTALPRRGVRLDAGRAASRASSSGTSPYVTSTVPSRSAGRRVEGALDGAAGALDLVLVGDDGRRGRPRPRARRRGRARGARRRPGARAPVPRAARDRVPDAGCGRRSGAGPWGSPTSCGCPRPRRGR